MVINDLKKIDTKIRNMQTVRKLRMNDYINENCPYKVGDIMTVTGFSFEGKKMVITDINMRKGFTFQDEPSAYKYTFLYAGDILNKNGEAGSRYTTFEQDIKEG
jgi:hypothetical protein